MPVTHIHQRRAEHRQARQHFQHTKPLPVRVIRRQRTLDEVQVHHKAHPRMPARAAQDHPRRQQQQRHQLDQQNHPRPRAMQVGEHQVVGTQQPHQTQKRQQAQHPRRLDSWLQPRLGRQYLRLPGHGRSPVARRSSPGAGRGRGTGRFHVDPVRACRRHRNGGWRHKAYRRPWCRAGLVRCKAGR